jgi:hypothetical protein
LSSAWTGLAGGSPVDEVEAVRIISGEPPGLITALRSKCTKPVGNDRTKTLAVMEEHDAFFFEGAGEAQPFFEGCGQGSAVASTI